MKLFEVFIQAGAILSVLVIYLKDIISNRELWKKVAAAFIPTAIVGLLLYKVIKNIFFNSDWLMLAVFIGVGLLFIISENIFRKDKDKFNKGIDNISYKEAVIVGLIQSLAVVPGVSRAGAVILGMMFLHYNRKEAAKFSFILAIPTILAASALDLLETRKELFVGNHLLLLSVGFITALISSYFVVKWFIQYLQRNTLIPFGWYRLVAGAVILLTGLIK